MEIKNDFYREVKSSISPYVFQQISDGYGGNYLSPGQAYWLWQVVDAVSTSNSLICWAFEQLEPVLYHKRTKEFIDEHALLDLINNPGYKTTSDRFQFELMTSFNITSEFYPVAEGNVNFEPFGLYALKPNSVSLIEAADGWLGSIHANANYDQSVYTRQQIAKRKIWVYQDETRLKETAMFTNHTKKNGLRGQSVLESVYYQALTKYYGNIHNSGLVKNGSRPSGLWSPKEGQMSQGNYEAFQNEVHSNFSGPVNSGRNVVSPVPVEYVNTILNPRDMDFRNLISDFSSDIYSNFGIPLPLVKDSTMTMGNFENATTALYDFAVLPRSKFLYRQLGKFLLPRYKDGNEFELTINEKAIPALKTRIFERVKKMRESYAFFENEIRHEAGYDIQEDGDIIWKPNTLVPSSEMEDLDGLEQQETQRVQDE